MLFLSLEKQTWIWMYVTQPQLSLSPIAHPESTRANTHSLTSNHRLCCLHGFLTAEHTAACTTCALHVWSMQPFFFTSASGSSVHLHWLAGRMVPPVRACPAPPCPLVIEWAALCRPSCLVGHVIGYMSSFPWDGVQGMFNLVPVL